MACPRVRTALVIEGEAGIGKTTVWLAAVRAAESRALRVLKARPAEREAKLSYAALADLVGAAFDETRAMLPPVQERALGAALLRAEADEATHARTTATALVSVLAALAAQGPVLVAVDDVQWLDPASEEALAFAVRRLPPRLGLLVARRAEPGGELPLGLARALPEERVEPDRSRTAVARRAAPPGQGAARVVAAAPDARAAGRGLRRESLLRAGDGARARGSCRRALGGRAAPGAPQPRGARGGARRRPVRCLAAGRCSPPRRSPTRRGPLRRRRSRRRLTSARRCSRRRRRACSSSSRSGSASPIRCSPRCVYGSASHERRRQLHEASRRGRRRRRGAGRHLALSATEPDEATAAELEQAARQAAKRGAQQAAAELYAASRRLTPDGSSAEVVRRTLGEASALLAGRRRRRRTISRRTRGSDPGSLAARRGAVPARRDRQSAGGLARPTEHLEAALARRRGRSRARRSHLSEARLLRPRTEPRAGDRARRRGHGAARAPSGTRRLSLPCSSTDSGPGSGWAAAKKRGCSSGGESWRRVRARRHRRARSRSSTSTRSTTSTPHVRVTRSRDEWYREHGEEDWCAERQAHLGVTEFRAGRWDLAEQLVEEACSAIAQLEHPGPWTMAFRLRAIVDADRGRTERGSRRRSCR